MKYILHQRAPTKFDVDGCPVLFVDSPEKIEQVHRMYDDAVRVGTDVEGYGADVSSEHPYKRAKIVSTQFSFDGPKLKGTHERRYIFVPNFGRYKGTLRHFKRIIADPERKKVLHNGKYDMHCFENEGLKFRGLRGDTMIKAHHYDASKRMALKDQMDLVFGIDSPTFGETFRINKLKVNGEPGKQMFTPDLRSLLNGEYDYAFTKNEALKALVEYGVKDPYFTVKLDKFFDKKLDNIEWYGNKSILDYYKTFDLKYTEVLFKMERRGVKMDIEWLEQLQHDVGAAIAKAERGFYKNAVKLGVDPDWMRKFKMRGPGCQKMLVELFEERLKIELPRTEPSKKFPNGKQSTSDASLSQIRRRAVRPLIDNLLDARSLHDKLLNTYINPFHEVGTADWSGGRLRTLYRQNGAVTTRLSSAVPNLQNIPRMGEDEADIFGIRKAFIVDKGRIMGDGDLSQIELRLIAHFSKDKTMLEAFRNDWDLHALTALVCFPEVQEFAKGRKIGKELLADIKKNFPMQRQAAKNTNFMIAYGGGPRRYAEMNNSTIPEGKRVINAFFKQYAGLKKSIDDTIAFCRKHGYILTLLRRRIHIPNIMSHDHVIRGMAERQAFNYKIQGSAAEIVKMAMLLIDEDPKLVKLDVDMVLQIHDELVEDLPKGAEVEAKPLLDRYLSRPYHYFGMKDMALPTPGEHAFADNWFDAKAA